MGSKAFFVRGSDATGKFGMIPLSSLWLITHRVHGAGIFTYTFGCFYMVNVGKYTIHGSYGNWQGDLYETLKWNPINNASLSLGVHQCFGRAQGFTKQYFTQ